MTDQHTPGPWEVRERIGPGHIVCEICYGSDGECIAEGLYDIHDASLISKAPDMKALLRKCLWEHGEFNTVSLGAIDDIRSLLDSLDNPKGDAGNGE